MRIKKYVADSMPEALKLVKAELGAKAVILNTRTSRKGGKFGIGGKGQVEVTAAVDSGKASAGREVTAGREAARRPAKRAKREATPPAVAPVPSPGKPRARDTGETKWVDRISRQIDEMQSELRSVAQTRAQRGGLILPGALEGLSAQMDEAGLSRSLAEDVLKAILLEPGQSGLKDLKPVQDRAVQMLAERFQPRVATRLAEGVRTVAAFVGPAGAGKTTAAARLAAHFGSAQNARVSFVAADTDRVGGLEQIRAYAAILDIPVDVAQTPEEIGDAVRERRDVDLILIDTAGASPLAPDALKGLAAILREAGASEVHLTLSATTDLRQMADTVAAYAEVGVDRLLLTKLDEAARLGGACTLAVESGLPLSYVTDGREVPGNLRPANPDALARALFRRRAQVESE